MKDVEGKGKGYFAKAKLPRGTRILAEEPILKVTDPANEIESVVSAFSQLSPEQQAAYLGLHENTSPSFRALPYLPNFSSRSHKVYAIWTVNHFGYGDVYTIGFSHKSFLQPECCPLLSSWQANLPRHARYRSRRRTRHQLYRGDDDKGASSAQVIKVLGVWLLVRALRRHTRKYCLGAKASPIGRHRRRTKADTTKADTKRWPRSWWEKTCLVPREGWHFRSTWSTPVWSQSMVSQIPLSFPKSEVLF